MRRETFPPSRRELPPRRRLPRAEEDFLPHSAGIKFQIQLCNRSVRQITTVVQATTSVMVAMPWWTHGEVELRIPPETVSSFGEEVIPTTRAMRFMPWI